MTAQILDGKEIAKGVIARVKSETHALVRETGVTPGLAVIIVGDDPASHVYVSSKSRTAEECGFRSSQFTLEATTSQDELAALIAKLNADKSVHGILVQLPLPAGLDADAIIQAIDPAKDVDGLGVANAGKLMTGDLKTGLISCTPAGAMVFVRRVHGNDLSGLDAVVIGRSNLFGKPMAALLLAANATVTTAHSRTKDLAAHCRRADILVAAVGRAQMVQGEWIKPGATVIDVGINRIPAPERGEGKTRLVGDVNLQAAEQVAGTITPVPGGVGPMTIAMLMANTLIAAHRAAGREPPVF